MAEPLPTIVQVVAPERTEHVTREVREVRAPTDDSVKLLREMEKAARDNVDRSYNVGGNGFECVISLQWEAISNDRLAKAAFELNGVRHTAEARVRGHEAKREGEIVIMERLRDAVAEVIATEMLNSAWPKV